MSILDSLLSIVAPYECLNCGTEGELLCERCSLGLPPPPWRCYRCQRLCANTHACTSCSRRSPLHTVRVATAYEAAAKDLVWQLKYNGARSAAALMARHMHQRLSPVDNAVIVPVPTATARARQRGYDQAVLLARSLSRLAGLPFETSLVRQGQTHQVGAGRRQRLVQLEGAFLVKKPQRLAGTHILLIDDVLTTGATLETAANALLASGAGSVSAAVFAQAI